MPEKCFDSGDKRIRFFSKTCGVVWSGRSLAPRFQRPWLKLRRVVPLLEELVSVFEIGYYGLAWRTAGISWRVWVWCHRCLALAGLKLIVVRGEEELCVGLVRSALGGKDLMVCGRGDLWELADSRGSPWWFQFWLWTSRLFWSPMVVLIPVTS